MKEAPPDTATPVMAPTSRPDSGKPPAGFEARPCEICGHTQGRLVVARPDLLLGGARRFTMIECAGCGAVRQQPRPTADHMMDYYPEAYQPYTTRVTGERLWSRRFRRYGLRKRCRAVTAHVAAGRLLDVGCATGDFLAEMRCQPGWEVHGLEPGHQAAVYARREVGLSVVEATLNQAPFAPGSFDAITLWDVLEHVYDPGQVLAAASRLLRPGGLLLVNHPNLESLDRRLFGRYWAGYELPRHLYLFPTALLRRLSAAAGLYEVERRCLYGSHAAAGTSLLFMVAGRTGAQYLGRWLRPLLFSPPARLLFWPFFKLIDGLGRGSNVTAAFVRLP